MLPETKDSKSGLEEKLKSKRIRLDEKQKKKRKLFLYFPA